MKPRYLLAAAGPQSNALANAPGIDLSIQSVFNILYGLTCWATSFIMVFIILILIWYGIQFMIARGDTGKFAQAKKNLTWAIIGIIVILGAQTIIATVANTVVNLDQKHPTDHYQYFAMFNACSVPND